jgi:ATP-dependent helicase/nuclease subunit A
LASKPDNIRILEFPWLIRVVDGDSVSEQAEIQENEEICLEADYFERMRSGHSMHYTYSNATRVPSKLTATQLKGRYKDQEVAEGTTHCIAKSFRQPEFVSSHISGSQYGTAMHTILQHIRYSEASELKRLENEVQRLVKQGLITSQLAESVNLSDIIRFFETDLGKELRNGVQCIREFKFSILDDAARYVSDITDELILLQGVVDCAIIRPEGITVIDFKTDRVSRDRLAESASSYQTQVQTYARALEKVYNMPVINAYLYYFRLGELVPVDI